MVRDFRLWVWFYFPLVIGVGVGLWVVGLSSLFFFFPFWFASSLFYRRPLVVFVSVLVVIARKSERGVYASAEDSSSTLISKELSVQLELDSNDSKAKRSQKGASLG